MESWLIETNKLNIYLSGKYGCKTDKPCFTVDPYKAIWFSRKEDAEAIVKYLNLDNVFVSMHSFEV